MANKHGLGDKGRQPPPTSNQRSCNGSSCQNKPKGNKATYSLEEDEEQFHPCSSSENRSYSSKRTSSNQPQFGTYRVAQRPGEDEDDNFEKEDDDVDEEEEEEDDFDEDEEDFDEDEDEDEDEEDFDEDEDQEEEESSTKKSSQYLLKYGLDSLMSTKKGLQNQKHHQNSNRPNLQMKKGSERKTSQTSRKSQTSTKKK